MTDRRTLEIPLPIAEKMTEDDVDLLEALCRTICAVRKEPGGRWKETAARLRREGWDVSWELRWVVDARRPGHHEQALGRTREEAFAELAQMTLLDAVEGCP